MEVTSLTKAKNRCLQRLLDRAREFVAATAVGGHATLEARLPAYERDREALLKTLDLFDRKLTAAVAALTPAERTETLLTSLRRDLEVAQSLIQGVLLKDEEVFGRIQSARDELLRELAVSERNKVMASKFKSTWVPESGEGLDRKA